MACYEARVNMVGGGVTHTLVASSPRALLSQVMALYKKDRGTWGAPGTSQSYMQLPTPEQLGAMPVGSTLEGQYMVCGPAPAYRWDNYATQVIRRVA